MFCTKISKNETTRTPACIEEYLSDLEICTSEISVWKYSLLVKFWQVICVYIPVIPSRALNKQSRLTLKLIVNKMYLNSEF